MDTTRTMCDARYQEMRGLIAASPHVDFAEFGDGVSEDWIARAESALGLPLPASYRWWSRQCGGGEIGGEEIYGIYCVDFDFADGGDIVFMHRLNQSTGLLEPKQIAICHSDIDGTFFWDMAIVDGEAEVPVVSAATGSVYATDFLEFLRKRIEAIR